MPASFDQISFLFCYTPSNSNHFALSPLAYLPFLWCFCVTTLRKTSAFSCLFCLFIYSQDRYFLQSFSILSWSIFFFLNIIGGDIDQQMSKFWPSQHLYFPSWIEEKEKKLGLAAALTLAHRLCHIEAPFSSWGP